MAHPCDQSSLEGAVDAARLGLISPILVGPHARIEATAGSCVTALVIPTNEELMIARHTRALLSGASH